MKKISLLIAMVIATTSLTTTHAVSQEMGDEDSTKSYPKENAGTTKNQTYDEIEGLESKDSQHQRAELAPYIQMGMEFKNDDNALRDPFMIFRQHELNYFLPFYRSFIDVGAPNKNSEVKFQISFKTELVKNIFWSDADIFFAYTQRAWFQVYNKADSRPFRDVDYAPEFFIQKPLKKSFLGGEIAYLRFGYIHTSNGERIARSRTSDRIMGTLGYSYENLTLRARAWGYIKHENYLLDNADLDRYMGYGDLRVAYNSKAGRASVTFGNIFSNPTKKYRGSIMAEYIYPIAKTFGIYFQYFYGYGDNIFEYKTKSHRFGVGISFPYH